MHIWEAMIMGIRGYCVKFPVQPENPPLVTDVSAAAKWHAAVERQRHGGDIVVLSATLPSKS